MRLIRCPGFLGGNFKDNLGSWSSSAYFPTGDINVLNPFDHSNIGSEWILLRIARLIKVEVLMNGTRLPLKEPGEYLYQIAHQSGMDGCFPHQILPGGVEIIVINHLVLNMFRHDLLL